MIKPYTLGEIASFLGTRLVGDGRCEISGLGTLGGASPGQLSFLSNKVYLDQLATSQASAIILEEQFADRSTANLLVSDQPYVCFARASSLFAVAPALAPGIHPSAVVDSGASVSESASIGPQVVIESGVLVGEGSIIEAGCIVGRGSRLGSNCRLHSRVTLYHDVKLGDHVIIHSGAVIGADGFGFAFDGERLVKIHQLGSVDIGNEVEIGAGTTIDRGTIDDTVIEHGVKIDIQVQIGHNSRVGEHTVICGCTAIAGSAMIGKHCVLGGASGMVGHLHIADGVEVTAMSLVSQSITEAGLYSSGTGQMKTSDWKRAVVRFQQLDSMAHRLRKIEKSLEDN
ncbi:MAG: UDP-3-O-(3-hydroxymyristoyl)glucosamine N-acyltransferase [Gammaproteobacteria bacterium]|nr:UDP-3-O-(3-hydroxymyristoyl)glucosamine N-acyltransferase [Gammaproteobacteria bacterium]